MEATPILQTYLETNTKFFRRQLRRYCVLSNDQTSPATNIRLYKDKEAYNEAESPTTVIRLCKGVSVKRKQNMLIEVDSGNHVHKLWCPDAETFDQWIYHIQQSLHENSFLIRIKKRELPPHCQIRKEEFYQTEITKNALIMYIKEKCITWNFTDIKKYSPRDVNGVVTLVFGRRSPTGSGTVEFVCQPVSEAPKFIYSLKQNMRQVQEQSGPRMSPQNSFEEEKNKSWNAVPDPPQHISIKPPSERSTPWKSGRSSSNVSNQPLNFLAKPVPGRQLVSPKSQLAASEARKPQHDHPRNSSLKNQYPSYDTVKERKDAWKSFGSSQDVNSLSQSFARSSLENQYTGYATTEESIDSWKNSPGSSPDLNIPTNQPIFHQQKRFVPQQTSESTESNTYDRLNHFSPQNQQTGMYAPLIVTKPSQPMLYENYPIPPPKPVSTSSSASNRKLVTQTREGEEFYASFSCGMEQEEENMYS